MYDDQSYQITALIQNTGTDDWLRQLPNQYYAFSYRWYDPRTDQTIDGNKAEIPFTVNKGMTTTVTLTLDDVPDWEQGAYRLQLDMIWLNNITKQQYSEFWFGDLGWPTYDLSVCLNGPCRSFLPLVMRNWVAGCEPHTGYWYPVGTNTCDPAVSNCAQGDGQPDGAWAGSWKTGSHQVEFSPQLVQSNTEVGTYWRTKPDTDGYGHLKMYVQVDGVWEQVRESEYQSTSGRWESVGIGSYAGEYITGLRFGFYWGSTWETDHEFEVDGYRMGNFMYCGE